MKKLLLVVAVLVGVGRVATPKAEAFVALNIGIPLPVPAYYRPYYGPGPYYADYYAVPYGYWAGGYWHGRYYRSGYYNRFGYGRHRYAHHVFHG